MNTSPIFSTTSEILLDVKRNAPKEIFCDVFDTILYRTHHPEMVKLKYSMYLSDLIYTHSNGKILITAEQLYKKRLNIESELVEKYVEADFKSIVNEIYVYIKSIYRDFNIDSRIFYSLSLEKELSLEKQTCHLNKDVYILLSDLSNLGFSLNIISDFYHDSYFIKEIFKHVGVNLDWKKMIISSEVKRTKRSGNIYEYLINQFSIKASESIMIGDTYISDYENAIQNNISKAYLLDRTAWKESSNIKWNEYRKTDHAQKYKELFKNYSKINSIHAIFSTIAPIFYLNIYSLHLNLVSQGTHEILFFSREGEFIKKIFDKFNSFNLFEGIISKYLKVSRASTFAPSLNPELKEESFEILFRQYRDISFKYFFKSLGLSNDEIEQISTKINVPIDTTINGFQDSVDFKKLCESTVFKTIYKKRVTEQFENFQKYLENQNIHNHKTLFVYDVGWKGSIQDNISNIYRKIFGNDYKIYGYYLGLVFDYNKPTDKNNFKLGLLFDYRDQGDHYKIFDKFRSLYEVILGASHGSAKEYSQEGTVTEHHEPYEQYLYENEISLTQDFLYKQIEELITLHNEYPIELQLFTNIVSDYFNKNLSLPKKKEIEFISKTKHYENFGIFEYTSFLNKEKFTKVIKYIINIKHLYKKSHWFPVTTYSYNIPYIFNNLINHVIYYIKQTRTF